MVAKGNYWVLKKPHVIGRGDNDVINFIQRCESAGGIPAVRTRYRGKRIAVEENGRIVPAVVVACLGAGSKVRGGAIVGVSERLIEVAEQTKGPKEFLQELRALPTRL